MTVKSWCTCCPFYCTAIVRSIEKDRRQREKGRRLGVFFRPTHVRIVIAAIKELAAWLFLLSVNSAAALAAFDTVSWPIGTRLAVEAPFIHPHCHVLLSPLTSSPSSITSSHRPQRQEQHLHPFLYFLHSFCVCLFRTLCSKEAPFPL